ncbi:hypothetical protein HRbin41_01390 [bacterium HR41]|nr:hypothetical protein HRbin41_01390 [bacterium HR41]
MPHIAGQCSQVATFVALSLRRASDARGALRSPAALAHATTQEVTHAMIAEPARPPASLAASREARDRGRWSHELATAVCDHRSALYNTRDSLERAYYRTLVRAHLACTGAAASWRRRLHSERGQGTVEYVALILLVALVLAGVVASLKGFRTGKGKTLADTLLDKITDAIESVKF